MRYNYINITLLTTLLLLLIFLLSKRTKRNKFHLDYILLHISMLVTSILVFLICFDFNKMFNFIGLFHVMALVFLSLHVESAIKGYKAKFRLAYLLPIIICTIISILNLNEVYLLNYSTHKNIFMVFSITDKLYYSDKILIKFIVCIPLIINLVIKVYKNINTSFTVKKKKLYSFWVYSYALTIFYSMLISNLYYFNILNPSYDYIINFVIRITVVISFLFFLSNPSILNYLPAIKTNNILFEERGKNIYNIIVLLFEKEKYYLNHRISLDKLIRRVGFSKKNIQNAIMDFSGKNFNDFVNEYRVDYSVKLINQNFLIKKNVKSLAEESGFNSHQTYYRAFRKKFGITPSEFNKMKP